MPSVMQAEIFAKENFDLKKPITFLMGWRHGVSYPICKRFFACVAAGEVMGRGENPKK